MTAFLVLLACASEPSARDSGAGEQASVEVPWWQEDPGDVDGDGVRAADGDCDELRADVHPGASDATCDGIDQDCDGADDYDRDGDGFRLLSDCDESNPAINPDATEVWYDGVDQDCDGNDDDQDEDGYAVDVDCDDVTATVYPGAPELENAADDNCNDFCDEGWVGAGSLVITELQYDPAAVDDTVGEWFEVHNPGSVDVAMCGNGTAGWVITDAYGLSRSVFHDVAPEVVVPAGGYVVFANNGTYTTNNRVLVDDVFASSVIAMSNSSDTIVLGFYEPGSSALTTVDSVLYMESTSGWPASAPGSSTALEWASPGVYHDATSNDSGANWCHGTATYGASGTTYGFDEGTPGSDNDCP